MNLAKAYCKEISKGLDKIPVYLPGTPVAVGDIISFGNGLLNSRPIGSFKHVSSLASLGVSFSEKDDPDPDPYRFASTGAVGVSFDAGANASGKGEGKLNVTFSREGATYLAAVDCRVHRMEDTSELEAQLLPHSTRIDWKNCFIVTSVTVAGKALIMQSSSNTASLTVEGSVSGLQPGQQISVPVSASVKVNAYRDSAFIKDWSDNVTVFFTLARFRKKLLGDWGVRTTFSLLINEPTDAYQLIPISPQEIFLEEY
jgi:hypothetical protein